MARAIIGLKKVKKNNPKRPQAAYFLGFCYFKLKRWYVAEKFLNKKETKKLPKRFAPKKEKLLSLIRKLRDKELEQIVSAEGPKALAQTVDVKSLLLPSFQDPDSDLDDERLVLVQAIQEIGQISRSLENHGYVVESLNVNASRTMFDFAGLIPFTEQKESNLGIKGSFGYESLNSEATSSTFITLEQTTGAFVRQERSKVSEAYTKLFALPFITLGFGQSHLVQLSAPFVNYFPQEGPFKSWGGKYGALSYTYAPGNFELDLSLRSGEQFDQFIDRTTPEQRLNLITQYDFGSLKLLGELRVIERKGDGFVSPSLYRGLLSGEYLDTMDGYVGHQKYKLQMVTSYGDFDLNSAFTSISRRPPEDSFVSRPSSTELVSDYSEGLDELMLSIRYGMFTGFNIHGLVLLQDFKSFVEVEDTDSGTQVFQNDGSISSVTIGTSFSPFGWLELQSDIGFQEITYRPINYTPGEDFKKAAPDFINFSAFRLLVGYDF